MSWPAVKAPFTQKEFGAYVKGLRWSSWRPSKIVWHNTALPTLAQWHTSGEVDKKKNLFPGTTRIANLENYFKGKGWSGGPHLFIADDLIWVFNPLTASGVHSPSWNSTSLGFEMVGDFAIEDDDSGAGLKVKRNCIYATAVLCDVLGLDPSLAIVYLHKEDPKTDHDCPGENIAKDKQAMIDEVQDLMSGGEHSDSDIAVAIGALPKPPEAPTTIGIVTADSLSFRRGPGINNESTGSLPRDLEVSILAEAKNGTTKWYQVRTPAGFVGWVSARYVQNKGSQA